MGKIFGIIGKISCKMYVFSENLGAIPLETQGNALISQGNQVY